MKLLSGLLHSLVLGSSLLALDLTLPPEYAGRSMEYSGLEWYKEKLLLLPQYPDGSLPFIEKNSLVTALENPEALLNVSNLPFDDRTVRKSVSGFEGYEALVIDRESLYLLVEARSFFGSMHAYLAKCRIESSGITAEKLIALPLPADVSNFALEALTLDTEGLIAFYEANGIVERPRAYRIDRDLNNIDTIELDAIPYRLTDATPFAANKAWALQNYWNGERGKLKVEERENFGRIIELEQTASGIRTTARRIPLHRGSISYNWEGIAEFEKRGFLIITDTHPKTVLRFVEQATEEQR